MLPSFDIICGVPYGGLPLATYISTKYNKPMILVRDKSKLYGTQKQIEGEYSINDRCVILEDVISTGKSIEKVINILKDKINIVDTFVIIHRQCPLNNISVKSLFYKNDITKYMLERIKDEKKSNICFSADLVDPNKILELLNKIGKYIVICKIHYDIIDVSSYNNNEKSSFKHDLVQMSIKHDFLIMEDRKLSDISYIVSKQYEKFYNWVDMITIHGFVSEESIQKISGGLLVANMSNNLIYQIIIILTIL